MQIEDAGILISTKYFREGQLLARCFLKNHGMLNGIYRIYKGQKAVKLVPGTIVNAHWYARLQEHMGSYRFEAQVPNYVALAMLNRDKHAILHCALNIMNKLLPEKETHGEFWNIAYNVLIFLTCNEAVDGKKDAECQEIRGLLDIMAYFLLEFKLIEVIGLGIPNIMHKFSAEAQNFFNLSTLLTAKLSKDKLLPQAVYGILAVEAYPVAMLYKSFELTATLAGRIVDLGELEMLRGKIIDRLRPKIAII